jgi:methenyltetrahydromethanopterin cyclohydrolase
MISVNFLAGRIYDDLWARSQELNLQKYTLKNGARLIDAGIDTPGGFEAGKGVAEICLGGLGNVDFISLDFSDFWLPGVSVIVSSPIIACMASQYAGWAIKSDGYFAMGSGPARSLARKEKLFSRLDYQDQANSAIIVLESRQIPDESVASYIAQKCGVKPENVSMLVAPTASLVGSVQVSARVVETGLHKMLELGFDISQIESGFGVAPLAPLAKSDIRAIGRTNDCVLYGGRVFYTIRAEDDAIESIIDQIPSASSRDYGIPFYELFKRYDKDFYKIDPLIFSPASVTINNIKTGRAYYAGTINPQILKSSLLEDPDL